MAKRTKQRTPGVPRAPRPATRPWLLPAFLGAVFLIKLFVLSQLQHHPLLQPDGGLDAEAYVQLARRVLAGDTWLGPGLYYVSPLYIYWLALLLGLSDSLTFVRVCQIILGTAAVGCVFVAARNWFSERAGWCAAVLAALTGVFTFHEIVLFQSSLDVFLTSAGLACLSAIFHPGPSRNGAASAFTRTTLLAGTLFGLQILNRPNIAIAAAGLALVLVVTRHVRAAVLFAAGAAIALAPVVVRNVVVSRQFALVSSQGGLNFYIGNHAAATGQYVEVPGIRANIEGQAEDTRRAAERALGHPVSDSEASSYYRDQALAWMRANPGVALRLFAKKLALVFNARHQWLDFSYPYYAYDTGSVLWMLFVGTWILVPLGLAGMGISGSSSRGRWLLVVFVALYAISVAAFFVAERYRLPLLVALCVSSGAAVAEVSQVFRKRTGDLAPRTAASPTALVVLAIAGALVAALPFDVPDGRYEERLRLAKVLMNRGDFGAATAELERAHVLRPNDASTEYSLGMAMLAGGRGNEGVTHLRHAVDAGVTVDGARYALANALLVTGDRDGAARLVRTYYPVSSDSAQSCYQVAILAMDAGVPDVARRYLERALQLRPGWPEAAAALDQLGR
jgi:Flp pilus assembly protein TadD